jgi:hypothetical protein
MYAVPSQEPYEEALEVNMTIHVKRVTDVSVEDQSISSLMRIQMRWFDEGLRMCKCDENKAETYEGEETFRLGADAEDWLWKPDLTIMDYRSFEREAGLGTKRYGGLSVTRMPGSRQNRMRVELEVTLRATVACDFNHEWFPYDTNYCTFRFGSSINDNKTIVFKMVKMVLMEKEKHHYGEFKLSLARLTKADKCSDNSEFSLTGFKVKVARNGDPVKARYTFGMYFVIGVLALGSFSIPANDPDNRQATDRTGTLSGALLCAVLLLQYVTTHNISKSGVLTPVLKYLILCLGITLACLLQYCVISSDVCVRVIISIFRKIVAFLRRARGYKEEVQIQNNEDEEEVEIQEARDVLDIVSFVVFFVVFFVTSEWIWTTAKENQG